MNARLTVVLVGSLLRVRRRLSFTLPSKLDKVTLKEKTNGHVSRRVCTVTIRET